MKRIEIVVDTHRSQREYGDIHHNHDNEPYIEYLAGSIQSVFIFHSAKIAKICQSIQEIRNSGISRQKKCFLHYFARFFKIGYLCSQFCHYVPYNEKTIVDKERPEPANSRGTGAMAVGFRNYNS